MRSRASEPSLISLAAARSRSRARVEQEAKTTGGIIIPDTAQEKPMEGEIIAVGPGARRADRVLFGKWSATSRPGSIRPSLLRSSGCMARRAPRMPPGVHSAWGRAAAVRKRPPLRCGGFRPRNTSHAVIPGRSTQRASYYSQQGISRASSRMAAASRRRGSQVRI
jgi:hypothetical protein